MPQITAMGCSSLTLRLMGGFAAVAPALAAAVGALELFAEAGLVASPNSQRAGDIFQPRFLDALASTITGEASLQLALSSWQVQPVSPSSLYLVTDPSLACADRLSSNSDSSLPKAA